MKTRQSLFPIAICVFFLASCSLMVKAQTSRTVNFAGTTWTVRSAPGNPGGNLWSDDPKSVWVDAAGALHMKIRKVNSVWYCSEVSTVGYTTYGIHRFQIDGRLDQLDDRMVFAVFAYKDANNEIDIEFSKWVGQVGDINTQYVLQPSTVLGHRQLFKMALNGTWSTHYFNWQPSSIGFKSFHGHYDEPPSQDFFINSWLYLGNDIPKTSSNLRVVINFWMYQLTSRYDDQDAEIVVTKADLPPIRTTEVEKADTDIPRKWSLGESYPNPFNPSTTIPFAVSMRSLATLKVYDALGREVATLISQDLEPGDYSVRWQANVPSGVYFYRLQAGEFVETKKMIVLH
jgi:hypothetical protein